ncbi:MAG: arginine--tRNA ligase, partial [Proteobacteria bacterium]|nr:arginine--tRNA ligase [Pseudomonadota bacterium]
KKGKAPADLFSSFKSDYKDKYFNTKSALGAEAVDLLVKWEAGDPEVRRVWKLLNTWVIDGFMDTYRTLGIEFDKLYYESQTYKLGKDIIEDGVKNGIFFRLPDNATAFDLSKIGLTGNKIVLRSNGTSVYITQDIGTAIERYKDYHYDKMIYVVADEQNHHFRVLFGILGELRPDLAGRFEHLSYGMVTLPNGRMKSREGTVVDTDDLIEEMARLVREVMDNKTDREHYAEADDAECDRRALVIALAALKYFLLNFTPTSWMEFNPEKSLDLQGRTGAYCLMNYARTRSILRKAGYTHVDHVDADILAALKTPEEKKVLMKLMQCPDVIKWAADSSDPSKIAEYLFNLCKSFAFIFTDKAGHPILTCEDPALKQARLALVDALGSVLKMGLNLLGIETLEEM